MSALGGVNVLVNNAAAGSRPSLSKTTRDEFLGVMAVNVWGPFQLARLCRESKALGSRRHRRPRRHGR